MKPKIFDRILLVLLMLVIMALGLGLIAAALGLVKAELLAGAAALPYAGFGNAAITAGIGLVLFVVALRLIIGFNSRAAKEKGPAAAIIAQTELGTSRITLAAVDEMVRRHCAANESVRECSSLISVKEGKLAIDLRLNLAEEASAPEVTTALRTSLSEYIKGLTGIDVGDISILVATAPEQDKAK